MRKARARVRRAIASLVVCGIVALLAAWPLWHVTRYDASTCHRMRHPCDPLMYLPFGRLALVMSIGGSLALVVVATWLVAIFIRGIIRHDARARAAHRASGG